MSDQVQVPADTLSLPGGGAIPLVGFGTWQLKGQDCYDAVLAALQAGYRHLDTAAMYANEGEVGRALADSGVPREEVFVTTKYNPRSGRPELDVLQRSLDALGVEKIDLWLIHSPVEGRRNTAIWESFTSAQSSGTARDIGVSNFSVEQIDHVSSAGGVVPAVNQIEWRPPLHNQALVKAHASRGVVLEGYSALKGGALGDPVVNRVAEQVGRTPAQVLVRWHVQHGIVVIPRSSKADRIRANADVGGFELSEQQMADLDGLGKRRS